MVTQVKATTICHFRLEHPQQPRQHPPLEHLPQQNQPLERHPLPHRVEFLVPLLLRHPVVCLDPRPLQLPVGCLVLLQRLLLGDSLVLLPPRHQRVVVFSEALRHQLVVCSGQLPPRHPVVCLDPLQLPVVCLDQLLPQLRVVCLDQRLLRHLVASLELQHHRHSGQLQLRLLRQLISRDICLTRRFPRIKRTTSIPSIKLL